MATADSDSILRGGDLFTTRYLIERVLGKGATSTVYLARDRLLDVTPLALKVLHDPLVMDENTRRRVYREVLLNRKVSHPGLVRIYDVGHTDAGIPYFTMELVEGGSLKDAINKGMLTLPDALLVLARLAATVYALHEAKICHRDLKPSNILLADHCHPKIADFSIARSESSLAITDDDFVGSVHYLAPEVWREEEADELSDIYSLGILAYELMTGVVPFDGTTHAELMCKHLDDQPVPPSVIRRDIPLWAETLVLGMLAKDRRQRISCAAFVATTILQNIADLATPAHIFDPEPPSSSISRRQSSPIATAQELDALYGPGIADENSTNLFPGMIRGKAENAYPEPFVGTGNHLFDFPTSSHQGKVPRGKETHIVVGAGLALVILFILTLATRSFYSYSLNQQRLAALVLAGIGTFGLLGLVASVPLFPLVWLRNKPSLAVWSWVQAGIGIGFSGITLLSGYMILFGLDAPLYEAPLHFVHSAIQASLLNLAQLITLKPVGTLIQLNYQNGLLWLSAAEMKPDSSRFLQRIPYFCAVTIYAFTMVRTIRIDIVKFFPDRATIVDGALVLLIGLTMIAGSAVVPLLSHYTNAASIELDFGFTPLKIRFADLFWLVVTWTIILSVLALCGRAARQEHERLIRRIQAEEEEE